MPQTQKSMKRFSLIAVAVLFATTVAHATPVKYEFSGTATYHWSYDTRSYDATPTAFSGTYTVDASNAEYPALGLTQAGCAYSANGVCLSDFGKEAPVITAYTVNIGQATWTLDPTSFRYLSTQLISNQYYNGISVSQNEIVEVAGPQSTHKFRGLSIYTGIPLASGQFPWTQFGFSEWSTTCNNIGSVPCLNLDTSIGGYFLGNLTSLSIAAAEPAPGQVPEPTSLALVGLGLAVLAAKRRFT